MDQWRKAHPLHADVPKVYTIGGQPRLILMSVAAILLLGAAVAAGWIILYFDSWQRDPAWFVLLILAGLLAILGAGVAHFTLRYRLILHADATEIASPIFNWRVRHDEIAGRRAETINISGLVNLPFVVLVPQGDDGQTRRFLHLFSTDVMFDNWLTSLPDLDKHQLDAALREILQNPDFGETEEIRGSHLRYARYFSTALNYAGAIYAVGTLAFFTKLWPQYYWLIIAILAALPMLAVIICITSRGLITIEGRDVQNAFRPNLTGLFAFPAVILPIRAWMDIGALDWQRALEIGAIIGLTMGLLSLTVRGKYWASPVLLLVFSLFWGSGAVVVANRYFDKSSPTVYSVRILATSVVKGKYGDSYYVMLSPWGPKTTVEQVEINSDIYSRARTGETICVYLYGGALGVRWFNVSECQSKQPPYPPNTDLIFILPFGHSIKDLIVRYNGLSGSFSLSAHTFTTIGSARSFPMLDTKPRELCCISASCTNGAG